MSKEIEIKIESLDPKGISISTDITETTHNEVVFLNAGKAINDTRLKLIANENKALITGVGSWSLVISGIPVLLSGISSKDINQAGLGVALILLGKESLRIPSEYSRQAEIAKKQLGELQEKFPD